MLPVVPKINPIIKKQKQKHHIRLFMVSPLCATPAHISSCLTSRSLFSESVMLFLSYGSLGCAAVSGITSIFFTRLTPPCLFSSFKVSFPSGRLSLCPRLGEIACPTAPKIPGVSLHHSSWCAVLSFSVCVSTLCLDHNSSGPGQQLIELRLHAGTALGPFAYMTSFNPPGNRYGLEI